MDLNELKQLRCPHNWGLDDYKDIEEEVNAKLKACELDVTSETKYASQISWYKYFCILSFENYRKGKYEEALKLIDQTNVTDDFMKKYDRVFKHVSMASRAHVLYKLNLFDQVREIIDKIKKENYSLEEDAGFKYVESTLLISYGPCGAERSVELIESALHMVNNEAEFNFFLGNILGRIRHFSYPTPPPSPKELNALKQAFTLRKDLPNYAIPLARYYMDARCRLPKYKKLEFTKLASSIYRNLLQYRNSLSGNDIARCVYNLMKLNDYSDLQEYAELAKKKSDSILMHHYIGTYFLRIKEYEEALECLEKASEKLSFVTGLVLLVKYRLNNNSVADEEIEQYIKRWLDLYDSPSDLVEIHLNISQFYLFVKEDLKNAALHFNSAHKHNITKRHFINLCSPGLIGNYLPVLRNELTVNQLKDEEILKALAFINKLPKEILTEQNPKWSSRMISEVRNSLL